MSKKRILGTGRKPARNIEDHAGFSKEPLICSTASSLVRNVSVDLVQALIRECLGDSRENRSIKFDDVWLPDIAAGLDKWLKRKKIISTYQSGYGETWPLRPGHWEVIKVKGKEYLIPLNSIVLMEDCTLEVNTDDYYGKVSIEVQSPVGTAQGILNKIRKSITKHGVMKGGVIAGSTILERSTVSLDNFFVNSDVLKKIQTHILNLFDGEKEQAFHDAGMPFKRGVLLVGTPGTGKTTLGKIIEALNPGITTIWLEHGQIENNMSACMKLARELSPTIIFMEDLDTVAVSREISVGNTVLGNILSEMDGRDENEGIIFIGTSNRPDDLDPAILRPGRFDIKIELDMPDTQTRNALLSKLLGKLSFPLNVTIDELSSFSKNHTQADIEELVRSAVLSALHEGTKELQMCHFQKIHKEKEGRVGF